MKYAAKIVLSFEKATFLITFFAKSLEVSRIFLNFATDSVSSFVWVSGLFTGKGRLRNVILESSNLANLNPLLKGKATRTSTKGVLYPDVLGILSFQDGDVFLCHIFIMRHDVGYLCCLS